MQKLKNLEDAEEEIFVTEFLSTDSEIKAKSLNLSCFQKKKGLKSQKKEPSLVESVVHQKSTNSGPVEWKLGLVWESFCCLVMGS